MAEDEITLQVFVKDVASVTGYTATVEYPEALLEGATFSDGGLVQGTFISLPAQVGDGAITGGGSTLPPTPTDVNGRLCTFTFTAGADFAGEAVLSLTSLSIQTPDKIELVTSPIDVVVSAEQIGTAAPEGSFDGDDDVDFDDFFPIRPGVQRNAAGSGLQFGLRPGRRWSTSSSGISLSSRRPSEVKPVAGRTGMWGIQH